MGHRGEPEIGTFTGDDVLRLARSRVAFAAEKGW